jgi:hypothetical protein
MKRVIFTLLLSSVMLCAFSQSTYYWVGGQTGAWGTATSWNTLLNGTGTSRSSANAADVLIFDGTNIGGTVPATGAVTPDIPGSLTIGQLKLQNNADVVVKRSSSAASGTGSLTINGDGTAADDLLIDASSKLTITSTVSAYGFYVALGVATTNLATGSVSGKVYFIDGGLGTTNIRIPNVNSLNFLSGSICYSNQSAASNYPFGSSSAGVVGGANFKAGSQFVFQGTNNPFSSSTHIPFIMEKGSYFVVEASNPAGMFTNKVFGNVTVRNNATVTLVENFYVIDTLTVNAGAAFNMRTSGTGAFTGNIINNGTFGAATPATSNHVIMIGTVPQSIGGTGTFNGIGALSVGTDAEVTLERNISIGSSASPPTSTITGKLNTQTYTINSIGATAPGNFQFRASVTGVPSLGTTTAGSQSVVLNTATYSGSINTANVVVGGLVTGTGIPANTYIIATSSSSSTFTISKPATASSGTDGVTITITANPATFITSNTAGADGSITTAGTKTYGSGTNFVFNAATTTPFATGSSTSIGSLTLNANVTTNRPITYVSGTLTLNSGKLTIQSTDSMRITSGNAIAGGSFSASKYIVTDKSGANVGVLMMDAMGSARTFPIGSATNYLPITLTPTTAADGFALSVFEGITTDGTANGTAMTAAQKAKVVDAVWKITRMGLNTDNCIVTTNWPASLEGSSFAGYGNSIGIAKYSSAWDVVGGSGDNTANTATNTFNAFSAFGVGQLGFILPVKLSNLSAKEELGKIRIQWNVDAEINVESYTIEKSIDGINYSAMNSLNATGSKQYNVMDNAPASTNFYRIKVLNKNGSFDYSNVVKIKLGNRNAEIAVFPNPVKGNKISLQLNNLEKGKADIKLFNNLGQQLFVTSVNYEGGSQLQTVQLPTNLAKGMYRLVVTNNNTNLQQTIFVD